MQQRTPRVRQEFLRVGEQLPRVSYVPWNQFTFLDKFSFYINRGCKRFTNVRPQPILR